MIKDNQKRLNRVHVVLDAVVTILAYALAWFIVLSGKVIPLEANMGVLEPRVYFVAPIFIVPVYLILYGAFHLYVPKRIQGRRSEFANICKANTIGLMIFTFVLFGGRSFIPHMNYFSARMLLGFFACNIVLLEAERMGIRVFLRSLRTNGYNQKHVLLIGYSRAAEGFIDRVISIRSGDIIFREYWIIISHWDIPIKEFVCWGLFPVWGAFWMPILWTRLQLP